MRIDCVKLEHKIISECKYPRQMSEVVKAIYSVWDRSVSRRACRSKLQNNQTGKAEGAAGNWRIFKKKRGGWLVWNSPTHSAAAHDGKGGIIVWCLLSAECQA